MNSVSLVGRLTRDPDVRYTAEGMAIARFSLAISRPTKEKQTDYPNVKALGKTAEVIEKYCEKGKQIAVQGSIQTGSYDKNGTTVYYTEVLANRIELLGSREKPAEDTPDGFEPAEDVPDGFEATDDELPF